MTVTKFPAPEEREGRPYRILALDGGGVRAIMSLIILERLQDHLDVPLHEYFDLIAGVSVGSVISCGLGRRMTPIRLRGILETRIAGTFNKGSGLGSIAQLWKYARGQGRYSAKGLEAATKYIFGDTLYGDMETTVLCVGYDLTRRNLVAFRSDNERHKGLYTWEIAKASASAPVLFPHHVIRYSDNAEAHIADGGLAGNNPAFVALAGSGVDVNNVAMLSVGTGILRERRRRIRNVTSHAGTLIEAFFYGAPNITNRLLQDMLQDHRYYRLQPPIETDLVQLDKVQNIDRLAASAREYLTREGDRIIQRFVSTHGTGAAAKGAASKADQPPRVVAIGA